MSSDVECLRASVADDKGARVCGMDESSEQRYRAPTGVGHLCLVSEMIIMTCKYFMPVILIGNKRPRTGRDGEDKQSLTTVKLYRLDVINYPIKQYFHEPFVIKKS